MNKNKKGFTVVELIIVISVIGILSAILIPTFVNLTSKANDAVDLSLVSNLNKALQIEESFENKKPSNMSETLLILEEQGYKLENLETKSDLDLLYNLNDNRFYLSDEPKVVNDTKKYDYWKIYDDVPILSEQSYSIYLKNNSFNEDVTIKVGLDLGNNVSSFKVNYERDGEGNQKVVIRTNGNDLYVNAPNDTVYHYGSSDNFTVEAISNSSLFVYSSSINFLSVSKGRIVFEKDTNIDNVFINDNNAIIAQAEGATLPLLLRSSEVNQLKIQTTTENGLVETESNLSIEGNVVTSTGNVPSNILNVVKEELSPSYNEVERRLGTKYDVRVGAEILEDGSNCYEHLQDAIDTYSTATASIKLYLLRDVNVDSSIVVNDTNATYSNYIYLNGFKIKGNNCSPLVINTLKKAFYIEGKGSLVGDNNNKAFVNNTNIAVTLNSIDTVGGFSSSATSQYTVINDGNHELCSFTGTKFRLDNPKSTITFDINVTDLVNPHRNVIVNNLDGTYSLRRITTSEATANGWTKVTNVSNTAERYASISEFYAEADWASYSLNLLADLEDNLVTTKTAALTIDAKGKTFTGKLSTGGTLTLKNSQKNTTGTFNITEIKATTFTIGAKSTYGNNVTINSGTVTKTFTFYNLDSQTLTINGGTFSNTLAIYKAKTQNLYINGGSFKKGLVISSTGTKGIISITGGTYASSSIFDTYREYVAEGYEGTQDSGKSTYSVHPIG